MAKSSVQFSPLTDWVIGGTQKMIQQKSSSSLFCRRPWWVLPQAGMSTLWGCPSSVSSANDSVANPPRCPEAWVWRICRGMWHAWNMQVSVSWQLPEEVPIEHKGVDLALYPVTGPVLQAGNMKKFLQTHHQLHKLAVTSRQIATQKTTENNVSLRKTNSFLLKHRNLISNSYAQSWTRRCGEKGRGGVERERDEDRDRDKETDRETDRDRQTGCACSPWVCCWVFHTVGPTLVGACAAARSLWRRSAAAAAAAFGCAARNPYLCNRQECWMSKHVTGWFVIWVIQAC